MSQKITGIIGMVLSFGTCLACLWIVSVQHNFLFMGFAILMLISFNSFLDYFLSGKQKEETKKIKKNICN